MNITYCGDDYNTSENPRSVLKNAKYVADVREAAIQVIGREQRKLPASMSRETLLASIKYDTPDGMWSDSLEYDLSGLLDWHLSRRRKAALAHVSISAKVAARHIYIPVDRIPDIGAERWRTEGVTIVRMTTGTGKTERALKPFAQAITGHGSVGIAAPLVAITRDIARRCEAAHYEDIQTESQALSADRVVTTFQSLDAERLKPAFRQIDYWGMDEATQGIEGLASDKKNKGGISTVGDYEASCHAIKTAKHLLLLDAGMNDATIEWVERIRGSHGTGEKFTIYDGKQVKRDLVARYVQSDHAHAMAIAKAISVLLEGGRPIIACESRDDAEAAHQIIRQSVPTARILTITSDSKGAAQKALLANADDESLRYDCLIHSPTLTSGVSIEHKTGAHFTHGIVLGGGFAVPPARMFQMMRRVRYLKEWSVFFKPNHLSVDLTENDTEAALAAIKEASGVGIMPWEVFKKSVHDRTEAAKSDFAAGLIWILEDAGFTVEMMHDNVDQGFAENVKETKDSIRETRQAAIMAARGLSASEAEAIRYNRDAPEDERIALEAYNIRECLKIEGAITEVDLAIWDAGRGVSRLHRLNDAMGLGEYTDAPGALFPRSLRRALYAGLFDGIDVTQPIGDRAARGILDRAIQHRILLTAVGILPAKYGKTIIKQGVVQEFPRPKRHHAFVGEVLARMGLDKLGKERNRHPAAGNDESTIHVVPSILETALSYAARIRGGPISVNLLKENRANGTISGDTSNNEISPTRSAAMNSNPRAPANDDEAMSPAEVALRDEVERLMSRFEGLPSSQTGKVWLPLADDYGLQKDMNIDIPDCILTMEEYLHPVAGQSGSWLAFPFNIDVSDEFIDIVRQTRPDRRSFILDDGPAHSLITVPAVRCGLKAVNADQACLMVG